MRPAALEAEQPQEAVVQEDPGWECVLQNAGGQVKHEHGKEKQNENENKMEVKSKLQNQVARLDTCHHRCNNVAPKSMLAVKHA